MENNIELEKKSEVVQPDTEVKTNEEQTATGASPETKPQADVSAELEKVRATLEKAEHTIVELKKAKKQDEEGVPSYTDEDIEAKVNEIVERKLSEITPKQDETLTQLAEAKRKVVEMSETLKAKSTIVNDGGGSTNQDKVKPDVEVPLTPQEEQLLSHIATRLGMSVRDYKIKYGYIKK